MNPRNRNLRSRALLCALAVLLALQPLSGSAPGNGEGLAELIKAVVCGCEACGAEDESVAAESRSCCTENAGEDLGDTCACGHPADFPLHSPTLLCEAPAGSTHGSAEAFLQLHASLSAATLDPLSSGASLAHTPGAGSHHGPPGPRPPATGEDGNGSPLGLTDGMPARLAVLCTALV